MPGLRLRHVTPPFRTFAGDSALQSLPRELERLGVSRAMVFCGPSMVSEGTALARIEAAIGDRLAGRFDGIRQHSPISAVEAARDALEDAGADGVIAVGGGSAIVTARAATILLAEGRDVRELCTRRGAGGRLESPRLDRPKLPQWVVPSTPTTAYAKAGSAVRDPESGDRLALFDPKTRAQGIFIDPGVALTAPIGLVQASALNALAMAIDGLEATDDPLAEALLQHAVQLIVTWLPTISDGTSHEPRIRLMLAALLSGQGSDFTGSGLGQPLSHAIGPRSRAANGIVEALLLPHTLRRGAEEGSHLDQLVRTFEKTRPAPAESSGRARLIAAVTDFLTTLDIPMRLRDIGLPEEDLHAITESVMDDWFTSQLPRPVTRDDVAAVLNHAW